MRIRLFLLLFVFISCGTRNLSQNNKIMISNVNRPNWTEDNCTTPKEQNKYRICVGRAGSKRSEAEAIRSAKSNAYEEILESFGAQVADKYEEHKRTKDGKTEISIVDEKTSITSAPMWVEGEEIGSFSDIDNSGYKAWFRMSITQKEFERIKTEVEKFKKKVAEQNRVNELMANGLTVWSLKSNVDTEECADKVSKELFPLLNEKGVKINTDSRIDFNEYGSVGNVFDDYPQYAYFVSIECNIGKDNYTSFVWKKDEEQFFREVYNGVYVVIKLYTRSGTILKSWCKNGKHAGYAYYDSNKKFIERKIRQNGISEAVESISSAIENNWESTGECDAQF